jgi:argininosuccinate lyase
MSPAKGRSKPQKSWSARLKAEPDAATAALLASIDVDRALWRHDLAGSVAHARMLRGAGLLSARDLSAIERGLRAIARDLAAGRLPCPPGLEDIHMVIEDALIRRVGESGRKLHTGRSRNDQVALDLRMWARDSAGELVSLLRSLQRAFVGFARRQGQAVVPAYTHLQRAQPVVFGHALLAYAEMLQRDVSRMRDLAARLDECPLGCGAVAGTSLPLSRRAVAKSLGFTRVARNSIDATSDRDFLADLCYACAMVAIHLSRWAEDWIIQATTEFGAIELSDAYCTSSSMMPQKKNPDALELIRGKAAGAIGQLTGMLALLKGLPLAYNRDLQDDKRLAFPAVAMVREALAVAAGIVSTARLREESVARRLDEGFLDATSLAECLVRKGVAFRRAHQIVGGLVARAERSGLTRLADLPAAAMRGACDRLGPDVRQCLGAANVVKRYRTPGAGGPAQLRDQLAFWDRELR